MSFRGQIGSGIAKGLCELDRRLRDDTPDMYLMSWENELEKARKKEKEQNKRDAAYKRMFGVWPGQW